MSPTLAPLDAAQGFIDLTLWEEAWEELENLPPEARSTVDVVRMRMKVLRGLGRWERVRDLAQSMIKLDPGNDEWPVAFAEALRGQFRSDLIDDMILTGAEKSEDPQTLYLAACHACSIGRPDAALIILKRLFPIDPHYRVIALCDPALNRFWSLFGEI